MEAKELRIGNLVYRDEFVCEITSVNPSEASYKLYEDVVGYDRSGFWDLEWFTPISLTEEWLIKFGLLKCNGNWLMGGYELIFDKLNKRYNVWCFRGIISRIKYVHQLQNLYFALTGEELEYEK